jgi:hypothetical protein
VPVTARIDEARAAVAEERRYVRAEHEAFDAFDQRIAGVSTVAATTGPPVMTDPRPTDPSLERIRTAYEATVMSVPHYEDQYGDTVAESLAVEFGTEIATVLVDGTALTADLLEAVRAATASARRERGAFLEVLDREERSLATAAENVAETRATLEAIDDGDHGGRGFDDLHDLWTRLVDLGARADGIGMRRQETIRGQRGSLPGVPTDLTEYLYADLSVSYPALASVADLGSDIERARRRVEHELASAG